MLMAQPSTYDKFERCYMLTAEPSTYDNFLFLLFKTNRKTCHMLIAQPSTYPVFFKNANMSYVDGIAINISHVLIDRAIW